MSQFSYANNLYDLRFLAIYVSRIIEFYSMKRDVLLRKFKLLYEADAENFKCCYLRFSYRLYFVIVFERKHIVQTYIFCRYFDRNGVPIENCSDIIIYSDLEEIVCMVLVL